MMQASPTNICRRRRSNRQSANRITVAGVVSGRSGYNIAELLIAITAIASLSVLAMTVISMLITAEQNSAESMWIDRTVANFAADLRDDAHRAIDVDVIAGDGDNVSQIAFVLPTDLRVTYECTKNRVIRRQLKNGTSEHTERYPLAFGTSWFETPGEDGLITWTHVREIPRVGGFSESNSEIATPTQTYRILATVGLHRYLATEENR